MTCEEFMFFLRQELILWSDDDLELDKRQRPLVFHQASTKSIYCRGKSSLTIKLSLSSLTGHSSNKDAVRAEVISMSGKIDSVDFPFSLMKRELIKGQTVDAPLHLWYDSSKRVWDWYTTKPKSLDPLVEEIFEFCGRWHATAAK